MATGIVKFFNDTKGFGFIIPEDGGRDVFVHKTAIELAGLSVLKKGEALSFELIKDKTGQLHASALKVLGAVDTLQSPIDRKSHVIRRAPLPERGAPSNDNSNSSRHSDVDGQPVASAMLAQKPQSNEKRSWQHNYDKYIEFARHAEDLVTREGHWQHAEHYLRLLNGSANF
jgi:CspA family cold shock protein